MKIDINCDMGESFGAYKIGMDEEVIKYITSANIACGFHAGDPSVMRKTVQMAIEHGVGVGAHPGYPDLLGFGRRNMDCTMDEIKDYVIYQVGALMGVAASLNTKVSHVKPHGNLYLMAVDNEKVATAIAEAVASIDENLIYLALAGSKGDMMREIGKKVGLRVAYEAFPDRAYTPDGTLVSRRKEGAVIKDPEKVAERALKMAKEKKVIAIDGTEITLEAETLCVHGDNPSAVNNVKTIRETLTKNGIDVLPIGEFL